MISVFDLFSIGIGPSSSHTVGPMRAARDFCVCLQERLQEVSRVSTTLYGSLAHTGVGHGTSHAIINGLLGFLPESIDPDSALKHVETVLRTHQLRLLAQRSIAFNIGEDLLFDYDGLLPKHSNAMRYIAYDNAQNILEEAIYYSIGGGFILREGAEPSENIQAPVPYPFSSAKKLLAHCQKTGLSMAAIQRANERALRSDEEIDQGLLRIAHIMQASVEKGCHTPGVLIGRLQVRRRAPVLYQKLIARGEPSPLHPDALNWVNAFAMAVNEENAAGGRVVTAPTNGAAGILPAVMDYYRYFHAGKESALIDFLLTAGAIATLFKQNASISGAEMGCQGEVGVACSMAAGALAAVLGGTPQQVEQAAEIGIEHNLGLTCDPVDGLVQIPCIERNAMGAVKAINAAKLALAESGEHKISLDMAIHSMREIGEDMSTRYKETSLGGLAVAVNIVEC